MFPGFPVCLYVCSWNQGRYVFDVDVDAHYFVTRAENSIAMQWTPSIQSFIFRNANANANTNTNTNADANSAR